MLFHWDPLCVNRDETALVAPALPERVAGYFAHSLRVQVDFRPGGNAYRSDYRVLDCRYRTDGAILRSFHYAYCAMP